MRFTTQQLKRIIKEELEKEPSGEANGLVEKLLVLVKDAFYEGWSAAPQDYWAATRRERDEDSAWQNSNAKSELEDLIGRPASKE